MLGAYSMGAPALGSDMIIKLVLTTLRSTPRKYSGTIRTNQSRQSDNKLSTLEANNARDARIKTGRHK